MKLPNPTNQPDDQRVRSSYEKFWKFKSESNIPTPYDWLDDKRRGDNIGVYWRVHDKLYDLTKFIDKHPGGRDWIEVTQGTDITEAFESSHVINVDKVEAVLFKYYVKDAIVQRNSPYEFKYDGFYKTLKRRVEPVLKKVGTGSTRKLVLTQDALAIGYILASLLGAWSGLMFLQILAGTILGMCVVGAHNFLHLKDTWRRFYFDLCPLTSFEFRITHGLSHHLYTNTILDYEVSALQPMLELLPSRHKNSLQRYGSLIYAHLLYTQIMGQDIVKRAVLLYSGKAKFRPENLLIFIQLGIFIFLSSTATSKDPYPPFPVHQLYFLFNLLYACIIGIGVAKFTIGKYKMFCAFYHQKGFLCWFITYSAASYWVAIVGLNAAHHHPACFHDGDEIRPDPDFGLCQLDATLDKADEFHKTDFAVLTTFGEHPLHHLFPTVCHSKLPILKPIFEQVLHEFLENNRYASQMELFIGTHRQYARVKGWTRKRQMGYQFGEY